MADTKISSLTLLAPVDGADMVPVVDMAPTPTTKRMAVQTLVLGRVGWVNLTGASPLAPDAKNGFVFQWETTLDANKTLNGPLNPIDGLVVTFRLKQDSTGSRTITLDPTKFIVPPDITVTLSTAANTTDFLTAVYCSSGGKYVVLALTKGATGI